MDLHIKAYHLNHWLLSWPISWVLLRPWFTLTLGVRYTIVQVCNHLKNPTLQRWMLLFSFCWSVWCPQINQDVKLSWSQGKIARESIFWILKLQWIEKNLFFKVPVDVVTNTNISYKTRFPQTFFVTIGWYPPYSV